MFYVDMGHLFICFNRHKDLYPKIDGLLRLFVLI